MRTFIALLRGINVGGHNRIAMADLKKMATDLGLVGAQTFLQSGNLVFQCEQKNESGLEKILEKETAGRLGVEVDFVVRNLGQWQKVIAKNPFPQEAVDDPGHLLVVFFKSAPKSQSIKDLKGAIVGRETVELVGEELFVFYPDGIGRSKLTLALIEKKLASRGTARNWNTVEKLKGMGEG